MGHLGYPIGPILSIFDLYVTPMLATKFKVYWPFGSRDEAKNRFSRWLPRGRRCGGLGGGGQLGFRIGMILAIFDLQVIPILPTKFQVSWTFGSGEEKKK